MLVRKLEGSGHNTENNMVVIVWQRTTNPWLTIINIKIIQFTAIIYIVKGVNKFEKFLFY